MDTPVKPLITIDKPEIDPTINLLGIRKKCTAAAVINIPNVKIGSSFKNDFKSATLLEILASGLAYLMD